MFSQQSWRGPGEGYDYPNKIGDGYSRAADMDRWRPFMMDQVGFHPVAGAQNASSDDYKQLHNIYTAEELAQQENFKR